MSDMWSWQFEDVDGSPLTPERAPSNGFPTQSDAENWLGEEWRGLLGAGVEAVHLKENGQAVYGPMSLRPAE